MAKWNVTQGCNTEILYTHSSNYIKRGGLVLDQCNKENIAINESLKTLCLSACENYVYSVL